MPEPDRDRIVFVIAVGGDRIALSKSVETGAGADVLEDITRRDDHWIEVDDAHWVVRENVLYAFASAGGDASAPSVLLSDLKVSGDEMRGEARLLAERADALEAEIEKWEQKLNSVGDDAQLANVDLQNILQKQQQTLQMMSNISKMLHDTAQAVIRKIGG